MAVSWFHSRGWPASRGPRAAETFSPLGYKPSPDRLGIVPTYPPGLPLLLAGASLVGGYCAMFWVVPISAALLVTGTYLLGRRLGGGTTGLIAAALVGSSPVFLYMFIHPMTDVPVAAAWTMSFVLLVGSRSLSATGAGLAAGLAVLIRPNLAPLIVVPLAWLAIDAWRSQPSERRARVRRGAWFVAGLVPAAVVLAVLNAKWYGSPWSSGYGDIAALFSWSNLWPNLVNYTRWFAEKHVYLPLVGLVALVAPGRWPWPETTDRLTVRMLGLFVVLLWLQYCLYFVFDAWWYLRFLLPCWPIIMIGFAQAATEIARRSRTAAVIVGVVIAGMVVHGTWVAKTESTFVIWGSEHGYVKIAELVRSVTAENSVILTMQHSGAVRYYGGRTTLLFNSLNSDWLDRAVDWLEDHGVHPYVLLDDWEIAPFKGRFADQKRVALLDALPVLTYQTAGLTSLYDLSRVPRTHPTLAMREFAHKGSHCAPPAPPPRLVLQ